MAEAAAAEASSESNTLRKTVASLEAKNRALEQALRNAATKSSKDGDMADGRMAGAGSPSGGRVMKRKDSKTSKAMSEADEAAWKAKVRKAEERAIHAEEEMDFAVRQAEERAEEAEEARRRAAAMAERRIDEADRARKRAVDAAATQLEEMEAISAQVTKHPRGFIRGPNHSIRIALVACSFTSKARHQH